MKRLTFLLISMLAVIMAASAEAFHFPYIREVKSDADMELSDSVFYKIARSVIFPVNKFHIEENSGFYQELVYDIIPDMNARGYRLESITIRGAASPEGPYTWNQFLGKARMKTLYDLIDSNMEQPSCEDCLKKTDIAEDYRYLLYMMAEADDKDYDRVKELVDRYNDSNIQLLKQRLMALDGGTLWKRLLHRYFPELRAARVVLFFKQVVGVQKMQDELKKPDEPAIAMPDMALVPPSMPVMPPPVVREPRRELLSVKTNLLFDFAYMPGGYNAFCPIPNVAIEYYPKHGHFTYGAMFDCPWWQGGTKNHKYFQVRNYTLETRYYLKSGDIDQRPPGQGAAFRGLYFSAYVHTGLYGIGWSDTKGFDYPGAMGGHGWQGEGGGAGIGLGYVLPISKMGHWRLEFLAQFGYFRSKYDPYIYGCPVEEKNDGLYYYVWYRDADEFQERQYRFDWLGPTRVGIQVSYDLLYRKNNKRGASFKAWEGGDR